METKSGNYFRNLIKELQIQGIAPVKKNPQDVSHVLIPLKRAPTETEWTRLHQDLLSVELVELQSEKNDSGNLVRSFPYQLAKTSRLEGMEYDMYYFF